MRPKISSNIPGKIALISTMLFIGLLQQVQAQKKDSSSVIFIDNIESTIRQFLIKQQDSTYIGNYTDELSLRLIGVSKFNYFKMQNRGSGAMIRYMPESKFSTGLGITYRWFSLDVTFNVGSRAEDIESSKAFDFQGRVFGLKQYVELTTKYYFGYKITNSANLSYELPDSVLLRDDIRTVYFGLDYLYAFNYGRFSFKAPFFSNEIQKKSAGSFVGGASLITFLLDGDKPIVPDAVRNDYAEGYMLTSLYLANLNLQFGYMYTLVFFKNFYITLSAIPALSLSVGDFKAEERQSITINPSFKMRSMNSIGYNARRFYLGLQLEADLYYTKFDKNVNFQLGHSKGKVFVGYRFKSK